MPSPVLRATPPGSLNTLEKGLAPPVLRPGLPRPLRPVAEVILPANQARTRTVGSPPLAIEPLGCGWGRLPACPTVR